MKRGNSSLIGSLLPDFIRDNGIYAGLEYSDICRAWDAVVGEKIAAATLNKRFSNGVLTCSLASSLLRAQLDQKRFLIITKINQEIGREAVKDIKFF